MNSNQSTSQLCYFCNSVEGKPRPIGRFIVELTNVQLDGVTRKACQSCRHKVSRINEISKPKGLNMKKTISNFVTKTAKRVLNIFTVIAFFTTITFAQGLPGLPPFPNSPSEAPIDGGLGLLAAAGGAYAWKKLRSRKDKETDI